MWRVYYEDGTTWSWTQSLDDMPDYGVMCILQKAPYYHIVFASKYYMLTSVEWLHAKDNDVIEYVRLGRKIEKLLDGRMTTNKTFREVFQAAQNDKDAENL